MHTIMGELVVNIFRRQAMENTYVNGFRDVLSRMKDESNREKYNSICVRTHNADEERIWELCQKFWPQDYSDRKENIEEYVVNTSLDVAMANRYLQELDRKSVV